MIGLYVVWRASRMGLPRIVVARMLVTALIDMTVGAIPFLGDVFDFWFKSNTRNLSIMRGHLQQPDRSTRDDWLAMLLVVGVVVAVLRRHRLAGGVRDRGLLRTVQLTA